MSEVEVGDSATREFQVLETDTAIAQGSGDVPVLGTPRAIAFAEAVSCTAIEERLEPGETTVGSTVNVQHCSPSQVGDTVVATAVVAQVERRRITFDVTVVNPDGRTALTGTVDRIRVDREAFLQ